MRRATVRTTTCIALAVAASTTASAGVHVTFVPVTISAAAISQDPALANMQSFDILVTTDGDWGAAGMLANLPAGQNFYNHPFGGNTTPNPALVGSFAGLAFDTYVTGPGDTGSSVAPIITGGFAPAGPLNVGSGSMVSATWGNFTSDAPGTYSIARLTFPRGTFPTFNFDSYTYEINPTGSGFQPHLGPTVTWPIVRWAPDADGDWNVAGNWSGNALPRTQQRILLDVGGAAVRTVTHASGDTVLHELRNFERVVLSGGTLSTYVTEVNGELRVDSGGTWRPLGFHHLTGTGVVNVGAGGNILLYDNTLLVLHDSTMLALNPGATLGGTGGVVRGEPAGWLLTNNGGRILAPAAGDVLTLHLPVELRAGSTIGGAGAVRVAGASIITGNAQKFGEGVARFNGALSISGAGTTLDVAGGGVLIDYTTGPSPLSDVRSKIISGYSNNTWTGLGINSSTAAADDDLAVGYAEASALFPNFPAAFMTESVDDTTLLVRLVRNGDANLDGTVNLNDFNRLAGSFGATGALWDDGDFNYDGNVNLEDFNLLAANFGQSAAGSAVTPADWAALAAAVPEPGSLFWFFMMGPLAARRCRRGR